MNTRRMTLALGAAAGGMLAAAFLQTAVAFADTTDAFGAAGSGPPEIGTPGPADTFVDTPSGSETGVVTTGHAPFDSTTTGTQLYTVTDTSIGGETTGSYDATVKDTDIFGVTHSDVDVTSDVTGTTGDPEPGSYIDTETIGNVTLTRTDETLVGGQVIDTDVLTTPGHTLDLPVGDVGGGVGGGEVGIGGGQAAASELGTPLIDGLTGLLGAF